MKKQAVRIILAEKDVSFITTCPNTQEIELIKEIQREYTDIKISIINIFNEAADDLELTIFSLAVIRKTTQNCFVEEQISGS